MHEFCLEATHKVLRYTSDEEEDLLRGVFAIRKVDEVLVMLRILDFRQLPQTRRTVMTARVKANLRYPSRYLTQIYSLQEAPDKSRILIELYLSTNKTFECLLVEDVISVERAVRLISDLVHGTVELLDYYLQRNVTVTQDLLCNAILLPSTLFILHDDTILFPNPCIATLDADLGFSNRLLEQEQWKRYAPPEIHFLLLDRGTELSIDTLEKVLTWSVGMLVSDLYSLVEGSDGIADAMVDTVFPDRCAMHCDVLCLVRKILCACLVEDPASRADCQTLAMSLEAVQNIPQVVSIINASEHSVVSMNTSLISDEDNFLILPNEYLCVERPREDHLVTAIHGTPGFHDIFDADDYAGSISSDYWQLEDEVAVRRHSISCYKNAPNESDYFNEVDINDKRSRSKSDAWSHNLADSAFRRYIEAATVGRTDLVAIYIGRCSRQQDIDGGTALMAATKGGKHECVSLLAQCEAGLQDVHGLSALMYAVLRSDATSVQLLCTAECGLVDDRGMTALMHAVEQDCYQVIHLLIEEVAMINTNHMSAYDIAVKLGHNRCTMILEPYALQLRVHRVARVNSYGYTALMFAAIQNDVATVCQLASEEGGVVAEDGSTALYAAILHNNYLCIPPLLRYERSITTPDGSTPLELAEKLNRYECARLLRSPVVKGYLPIDTESCLMKEARHGDPELLRAHLNEVLLMSARGETALMIAAGAGSYRCVKDLLQYEQGMVSPTGWTALMYASMNGHLDCVSLLCATEARITNTLGQLAYDIAVEKGHKACARFLSKYEEHLTVAYRVDELLALDRIGDAVRLLKQPFVLSAALVKCIWSVHGGEFMVLWGALRANVDLTILAKYITLEMSVDLNDPELTDLVLKRKAEYQLVSAGQNNLESLLHKALCSQKFLVIPVICEHAMTKRKRIFVQKRVGKAVTRKTRLMIAAEIGDLSEVEQNLQYLCFQCKGLCTFQRKEERHSLETHNKTVSSVTALMLAAANGHRNCVPALLPELGLRDQASGTTALILALWYEDTTIVRLLLPEANIADNSGMTPLMHASKKDNKKCAQLLKSYLKAKG
ncbi:Ankyrin repeat protein 1 [Giardia duodenalis]|uniref:Ankyrin repeat protein 1 n=1 Tax=Giardia intestinalis (strain ATCC 50803 / WB clone C6) TaxID=184922 RepID=A8BNW1_GIAIC|nr:Ankyrin repeat protein 1 [Giardia intestinalis]KAE8304668.1 Ankyrin repeat protein 1 [Giardia intestinalis]|eukprot:XP_001705810.1 Protein 21.1 [Giardia lamblia ATCC 50803]